MRTIDPLVANRVASRTGKGNRSTIPEVAVRGEGRSGERLNNVAAHSALPDEGQLHGVKLLVAAVKL